MANVSPVVLSEDLQAGLAGLDPTAEGPSKPERERGPEAKAPARARARAKPAATVSAASALPPCPEIISPLGAVPTRATHWGVKKRNDLGEMIWVEWSPSGSPVALREWPLAELTIENLHQRWGPGHYEAQWLEATGRGGRRWLRPGRVVHLNPREVPAAAPPSEVAASIFSGPLGDAFSLMKVVKELTASDMSATLQLVSALGAGQQRAGLGAAELELIMRNSQEATMAAVRAAVEPMKAELAALRARDAEEDEGDGPDLASAATGAVLPLLKGKGALTSVANWASANPELTQAALPIVREWGGKLLDLVSKFATPTPAARAVATPRAAIEAPTMAPPAPPREPVVDEIVSLSSWPGARNGAATVMASPSRPPSEETTPTGA